MNGTLASNQYFKWTEGGQEIISSQMITIEYTNSQSILTIHNATFHHYGEYTCQCHNNFTAEDIQSIIADDNPSFYPKCSQPTSTLVLPTGIVYTQKRITLIIVRATRICVSKRINRDFSS